ncbi:MAG: hypothetical protein ACOC6F_00525 [bacterium]
MDLYDVHAACEDAIEAILALPEKNRIRWVCYILEGVDTRGDQPELVMDDIKRGEVRWARDSKPSVGVKIPAASCGALPALRCAGCTAQLRSAVPLPRHCIEDLAIPPHSKLWGILAVFREGELATVRLGGVKRRRRCRSM